MTKKNFITLIVGAAGGLLFSIGMCMCLLPEWNVFRPGAVLAAAGFIVLLALLIIRWKTDGRKFVKPNWKIIGMIVYIIIGALSLGTGMCMIMVWNVLVLGMAVGVVGILLLIFLIPMLKGLK